MEASLERLVKEIDPSTMENEGQWKRRYFAWAEHHTTLRRKQASPDEKSFQELSDRLSKTNHAGRLYAAVMSNLVAFFSG